MTRAGNSVFLFSLQLLEHPNKVLALFAYSSLLHCASRLGSCVCLFVCLSTLHFTPSGFSVDWGAVFVCLFVRSFVCLFKHFTLHSLRFARRLGSCVCSFACLSTLRCTPCGLPVDWGAVFVCLFVCLFV